MTYDLGRDPVGELFTAFGGIAMPTTIFIDDSGVIVDTHSGALTRAQLERFLIGLADAAADGWTEPDHGIWEVRGEPRHYLHSKLMCWVALDRAIELAPRLGADDKVDP